MTDKTEMTDVTEKIEKTDETDATEKAEKTIKAKPKRLSKGARTHRRRQKQAARKPGGQNPQ